MDGWMDDIMVGYHALHDSHATPSIYLSFYQVGKGRDMGFLSILGFFCKLSCGTAQMTTSRQAFRLGQRLGTGRLLGWYYGHIGFYLGQLHFYHAAYLPLALAYVGAAADATGVLPGAAAPALAVLELVYGVLAAAFLGGSLLPLALTALAEDGALAALTTPLVQLLSGSPIFFILQSRCIGAYFSGEFATGGASYIPTGRQLAISHQPFSRLFASFAASCLYPGGELVLLLGLRILAMPTSLPTTAWCLVGLMPASLLWGPAFFNPHVFKPRRAAADLRDFCLWIVEDDGWAAYFQGLCQRKRDVAAHSLLLPSKELILACGLAVISFDAMRPYGWGLAHLAVVSLPLVPLGLTLALLLLTHACRALSGCCSRGPERRRGRLLLAAFSLMLLLAEGLFVSTFWPWLPRGHVATLVGLRFFGWRFAFNALAYLGRDGLPPLAAGAARPGRGDEQGRGAAAACAWLGAEAARRMVSAHALVADCILGLLLQLPVLLLALLPWLHRLHFLLLFRTTHNRLQQGNRAQQKRVDELSTPGSIPKRATMRGSLNANLRGSLNLPERAFLSFKRAHSQQLPPAPGDGPIGGVETEGNDGGGRDEMSRRLTDDDSASPRRGQGDRPKKGGESMAPSGLRPPALPPQARLTSFKPGRARGAGKEELLVTEKASEVGIAQMAGFFEMIQRPPPLPKTTGAKTLGTAPPLPPAGMGAAMGAAKPPPRNFKLPSRDRAPPLPPARKVEASRSPEVEVARPGAPPIPEFNSALTTPSLTTPSLASSASTNAAVNQSQVSSTRDSAEKSSPPLLPSSPPMLPTAAQLSQPVPAKPSLQRGHSKSVPVPVSTDTPDPSDGQGRGSIGEINPNRRMSADI